MRTAFRVGALALAVLSLVAAAWWVRRAPTESDAATTARDERRAILPMGSPSDFFMPRAIGDEVVDKRPPQISNLQVIDLDRDGLPDILVCDVIRGQVTWIRQSPEGTYTETPVGGGGAAPAPGRGRRVGSGGGQGQIVGGRGGGGPR